MQWESLIGIVGTTVGTNVNIIEKRCKMVIVCEDKEYKNPVTGEIKKGFYMDGYLQKNLDFEIKRVKRKWDCIMLVDGQEGVAKTTMGSEIAEYMSAGFGTTFELKDMIYTVEQFEQWVDTQPPESVCVWDEFVMAGLSTEALTKIQNALVKRMTIMRQKRLVVILIVPYIFLLRKYFAIARTRCLINVYSPDNIKRGYFKYFSYPNKRMLFMKGNKYWEYNIWKPDFFGRFTDTFGYFFDVDEYNKKKNKAMVTLKDIGEQRDEKWKERVIRGITVLRMNKVKWKDVSHIFGMNKTTTRSTHTEYLEKHPDFLEKQGFKGVSGTELV